MATDKTMMNPSQRVAGKDFSKAGKDFYGGVAPAAPYVAQPYVGNVTPKGPSQVVQGVYVSPEGGSKARGGGF